MTIHTNTLQLISLPYINITQQNVKAKVTMTRSKVKLRLYYDEAQLHFLTNIPTKYGFRDMTRTRSRLNYDVAQLKPLTNVPAKYQLPTSYGF